MADPQIPGDKKNEADNNNPLDLAQEEQALTLDQEGDAKPAVMAGLSEDEIGLSAKAGPDTPKTPDGLQNPSAQDLKDAQDVKETLFTASPHSNDVAFEQINKGLQGASEGHIAGVIGANQEHLRVEEQKKKEETMARNLAAIAMSAEMQAAYAKVDAALSKMEDDVQEMSVDFEELSQETNQVILEMQTQRDEAAADLARYEQELRELQDGTSSIYSGDDPEMLAAQIALKQAEISNAESRINLIDKTISETQATLAETQQTISESVTQLNELRQQEQAAKLSGDPEGKLEEIRRQMAEAQDKIAAAKASIGDLEQKAEITKAIGVMAADLEDKSLSCGINAQVELEKVARINAKTDLINTLSERAADGEVTHADMKEIDAKMKAAGIDSDNPEARNNFIAAVYSAGGAFYDQNGAAYSQEDLLTKWDELQKEQVAAVENLETVQTEQQLAQAEYDAIIQQEAVLKSQLAEAQGKLDTEKQQTLDAQTHADTITSGLGKYDSMQAYMQDNFSITVDTIPGVEMDNFTVGKGPNIDDVAKDRNNILQTDDGQFIYMDNSTMEMYTLSIDPETQQQEKVLLSPEDSLKRQAEMVENKLVPRNFVADDAFPEYSKDDTYVGTLASSLVGMNKEQTEQQVAKAVETQTAQQEQAARELEEKAQRIAANQDNVDQISQKLTNLEALKVAALERVQKANAAVSDYVAQHGDELENRGVDTATALASADTDTDQETTQQSSETSQRSADEALVLDTPDHHLDQAEAAHNKALGAIEAAVSSGGTLTQEQYDELAQTPGMSPEKLDAMMSEHKVEVNDFASNVALESDSPTLAPPANAPIYVQHFGQTVEHAAIPAPAVTPDANGVEPGIYPGSFADSPEFAATNPTSGPEPTYMEQINNHIDNVANVVSNWFDAQNDEPKVAASGMTPEQQEQLRLQQQGMATTLSGTTQNDPQANNPSTGTGGGMMG